MGQAGEEMTMFSGSPNRQRMAGDIPYLAVGTFKDGRTSTTMDGRICLLISAEFCDHASFGTMARAVPSSSHRERQLRIAREDPQAIPKSFALVASTQASSGNSLSAQNSF